MDAVYVFACGVNIRKVMNELGGRWITHGQEDDRFETGFVTGSGKVLEVLVYLGSGYLRWPMYSVTRLGYFWKASVTNFAITKDLLQSDTFLKVHCNVVGLYIFGFVNCTPPRPSEKSSRTNLLRPLWNLGQGDEDNIEDGGSSSAAASPTTNAASDHAYWTNQQNIVVVVSSHSNVITFYRPKIDVFN